MTRNLQSQDDFEKGDVGCATGHKVIRTTGPGTPMGSFRVTALQHVKAGTNGWFEDQRSKVVTTQHRGAVAGGERIETRAMARQGTPTRALSRQ